MEANRIKFPLTYTAVVQCISLVLMSFFPFAVLYTTEITLDTVTLVLAAIPSGLVTYMGIAKIFTKRIVVEDKRMIFHNGPFRYKLQADSVKIYYEKVWVLGGNYKDYFGLVLHRDLNKMMGFYLNNRFVLTYEMDEIKLEYYQKEFRTKTGIDIHVVKPLF